MVLAVGLVVMAVAVAAAAAVSTGRGHGARVGPAVAVTPEGGFHLVDQNNSPSVAVSPTDRNSIVVANRVDRPGFGAAL